MNALIKSEEFLRTVQSLRLTEGIAPHPAVAYWILVDEEQKGVTACLDAAEEAEEVSGLNG